PPLPTHLDREIIGRLRRLELDLLFSEKPLVAVAQALKELSHQDPLDAERVSPALEPTDLEQIAHDVLEALGFLRDDLQIPRARGVVDRQVRHRERLDV